MMTGEFIGPCFVYRFFGEGDVLLYVGVSDDPARRWAEHRVDAPWWAEMMRCEVMLYASRAAALQAEAIAISVEKPRWNAMVPRVREDRPTGLSEVEQLRVVTELQRAKAAADAASLARLRAEIALDTARRRLSTVTAERDHYRRRFWEQSSRWSEAVREAYLRGRNADGAAVEDWLVDS